MDKSINKAIIERGTAKNKKYKMTFLDKDDKKVKTTQFG
jgi:hypothetical protein